MAKSKDYKDEVIFGKKFLPNLSEGTGRNLGIDSNNQIIITDDDSGDEGVWGSITGDIEDQADLVSYIQNNSFSGDYEDLTSKPDLSGFTTESYVDNKVSEVKWQDTVDFSDEVNLQIPEGEVFSILGGDISIAGPNLSISSSSTGSSIQGNSSPSLSIHGGMGASLSLGTYSQFGSTPVARLQSLAGDAEIQGGSASIKLSQASNSISMEALSTALDLNNGLDFLSGPVSLKLGLNSDDWVNLAVAGKYLRSTNGQSINLGSANKDIEVHDDYIRISLEENQNNKILGTDGDGNLEYKDSNEVSWSTIEGKPAVVAEGATAADARTSLGLGTAATTDSTAYATAAQGSLADSAVQPATLDSRLSAAQRTAINALVSPETDYADMTEATAAIKAVIDALKAS